MQGLFNRLLLLCHTLIPHDIATEGMLAVIGFELNQNSCQNPFIGMKLCKSQRFVPPLDLPVFNME